MDAYDRYYTVVVAFGASALAVAAIFVDKKYGSRGLLWLLGLLVLASVVQAFRVWLPEQRGEHFTNPQLGRLADWFAHWALEVVQFVLPISIGIAVTALLRRTNWNMVTRMLLVGASTAVFLWLSVIPMLIVVAVAYHDGP